MVIAGAPAPHGLPRMADDDLPALAAEGGDEPSEQFDGEPLAKGEPLQFIDVVYAEEEGTDVSPEVTEGDVQNGLGKLLVRASGNSYAGGFKNGKFNGKGKMVYGNGMGYEGDWIDGLRHGYGKMTYANGEQYEGRWENNQPQSLFPVIKDSKKKKKRRGR